MEAQKISDNLVYLVLIGTIGGLVLASSVVLFYIRYQRRFIRQQADLQKAELEHKQQLLHSIIQSQEEERIRISKDLHDHVGSSLSGLRFLVSRITGADADTVKTIATDTKANIDRIIEDVRNISHSLSPAGLELWGFHEALEEYCDKTARASGIEIQVADKTGNALKQLSFDVALSLFRVIQELINNTIKHAAAQHVSITITPEPGAILITYKDDGKGIDLSNGKKQGIGMYNIESRLSMIHTTYSVASAIGKGYTFIAKIPATLLDKTTQNG